MRGCQGLRGGDTGGTINGYGVSFWFNENFLGLITVMLAQSVHILKTTIHFKWACCIICELYHNTAGLLCLQGCGVTHTLGHCENAQWKVNCQDLTKLDLY